MKEKMILEKQISCRMRKIRNRCIILGAKECIEINACGEKIWNLIDGKRTIGDVIIEIQNEYNADFNTVKYDVTEFLKTLLELEAVKEANVS